ncbi:MAG: hypothetical protein E7256_11390 [Lachnospiraceae bacterium]|nr:hypothetical protein [Lachnospiraceae bacterium]
MSRERDYLFSNIKAFLIVMVVFGHFLELNESTVINDYVKMFIYFFHMPAFIFISGYFTKDVEKAQQKAFSSYLVPFFIMTILYCIAYPFIARGLVFRVVNPIFAAWYLQVLFFYKVSMKYLVKIKYILPISVFMSLAAGMVPVLGKNFSLQRTFALFPMFLLGYYCKEEHVNKLRAIPKKITVSILCVFAAGFYIFNHQYQLTYALLMNAESYHAVGVSNASGILVRVLIFCIALLFISLFLNLFPNKKTWYSYIGDNTLAVYSLHGIFYLYCKKNGVFQGVSPVTAILIELLVSAVIVFLFTLPKVNGLYGKLICLVTTFENNRIYGRKKHVEESTV